MKLPNVWGQGSLFAFSGLDGENTYKNSLVGTLCGDRLGVVFHTAVKRELSFRLRNIADIEYEIVASDVIKAWLLPRKTETKVPLILLFYTQDTVLGLTTENAAPEVSCAGAREARTEGRRVVHGAGSEYTCFLQEEKKGALYFSFSYSGISEEEAFLKAEKALQADIYRELDKKLAFFAGLPRVEGLEERTERTLYKCFSVMKSQVYTPEGMFAGRWTTPDRLPHKKLWLWDSIFHSLGNVYISQQLACESIRAVLATQREDGFIPHMAAPPEERSDVTQPPVIAWGLYRLYRETGSKEMLEQHFDALKKYLVWNGVHRDSNRNHLYEWEVEKGSVTCRCAECGMDNSPRFDNVTEMDCIDFSCFMANEAQVMAAISRILDKTEEEAYWTDLYSRIKAAVNRHLWDDRDGLYYDRILETGELKKVKAVSSFLPLFAGLCAEEQAKKLAAHLTDDGTFGTVLPIPSVAVEDATFGTDMWRGPVWINYNYMVAAGLREYGYHALAKSIVDKTVRCMSFWYFHDGVVYEFYDSMDRVSPAKLFRKGPMVAPYNFDIRMQSIRDYGWSCALFAAMILEERNRK